MSLGQETLKQNAPESTGPDAAPDVRLSDCDYLLAHNIQPDDPRLAASNWRELIENPDATAVGDLPANAGLTNEPSIDPANLPHNVDAWTIRMAGDETAPVRLLNRNRADLARDMESRDEDQTETGTTAIPRRTRIALHIKPLRRWAAWHMSFGEPVKGLAAEAATNDAVDRPTILDEEIRYSDYPFAPRSYTGYSEPSIGYGSYTDQIENDPTNPAGIYTERTVMRFGNGDFENATTRRTAGKEALQAAIAHEAMFGTDESYSLYREASHHLNAALTYRPTTTIRNETTGEITLRTQEADWETRMEYGHCLKKLAQISILPEYTDPLSKGLDRREVYEEIAERNLKHSGELMVQSLQAKHDHDEGVPAEELVPATLTAVNDLQELGANEAAEALLHEATSAMDDSDKRRFERFIDLHTPTEEHQVIDISDRIAQAAILDVMTDSHRSLAMVA